MMLWDGLVFAANSCLLAKNLCREAELRTVGTASHTYLGTVCRSLDFDLLQHSPSFCRPFSFQTLSRCEGSCCRTSATDVNSDDPQSCSSAELLGQNIGMFSQKAVVWHQGLVWIHFNLPNAFEHLLRYICKILRCSVRLYRSCTGFVKNLT